MCRFNTHTLLTAGLDEAPNVAAKNLALKAQASVCSEDESRGAKQGIVVVRLTISGTQSGNFMGFPPIGNLKTEEIFILEIREDKIVRQHGLVDLLPVLRARGANPTDS
jgi:hypothetical protein